MLKWHVLCLLLVFSHAQSAKILGVFPLPLKSHHILGSALLKELASRGHDVTMISPFPLKPPPKNYHDVNLEGILELKQEYMQKLYDSNNNMFAKFEIMVSFFSMLSRSLLDNKGMQDFLKTKPKYDLVIHSWALNEALLGIGHALNSTTISFSTVGTSPVINYATGQPTPYSYVPHLFSSLTDDMNFLQRVLNTVFYLFGDVMVNVVHLPLQQKYLQEFFPGAPPLHELIDDVHLFLFNTHFATESPRPYLPNMIQIGGFHLQQKQDLPADLKEFLDNSKNGVIYFSFGSNLNSDALPAKLVDEIVNGLSQVKYDVLWKFDYDLKHTPKNFKTVRWVSQLAVLEHLNVKVFITHGGLGSTVESIYHGVPMICVPLFGDQEKNVADTVGNGFGIKLDKNAITSKDLVDGIKEIAENPGYRERVLLQSDIYQNQEMNPMDKAVYWIEHVLKHKGAKHLRSVGRRLPWYKYMLLDVAVFIGSGILIAALGCFFALKMLLRCCCKWKIAKVPAKVKKSKTKNLKRM